MKSLLLVQKEQRIILDRLYDSVCEHLGDCDLIRLGSFQQDNLKRFFRSIDINSYDRIIFFLRFKKELKQVDFIKNLPNLVILEHDACQNYIRGNKYYGQFSRYYRAVPWARVICSGYQIAEKLRNEGSDACFVSKGYDQALLRNLELERDIELGFLGSMEGDVYRGRRAILSGLAEAENLIVARTDSTDEYLNMLNRIKMFVSADAGLGEYMVKNFEAMACGCVVLAYDQGETENSALGFEDMENIVLYRDIDELKEKIAILRRDSMLAAEITRKGQQLAEARFSWFELGREVAECIKKPLRERKIRRFMGMEYYTLKTYE